MLIQAAESRRVQLADRRKPLTVGSQAAQLALDVLLAPQHRPWATLDTVAARAGQRTNRPGQPRRDLRTPPNRLHHNTPSLSPILASRNEPHALCSLGCRVSSNPALAARLSHGGRGAR